MSYAPALASTLKGHNGKGGSGISPEDTFLPVYENDGHDRIGYSVLQSEGDGKGFLAADDGGLLNTVDTHHVGHNTDSPKPASDVKAFSENQRAEVLETPIARQLMTGGGKPGSGYSAVRQGASVRRLTPTECERLQGLPDGWTAYGPDSRRYAALGDAVTSSVGEWIGQRILVAA